MISGIINAGALYQGKRAGFAVPTALTHEWLLSDPCP